MTILKNILIFILVIVLAGVFISSSFVFSTVSVESIRAVGNHDIKKAFVSIGKNSKGVDDIFYTPYNSGATASGVLSLDFGQLSTAFVIANRLPSLSFSGNSDIFFENIQGIISLYDPFSLYNFHPTHEQYQVSQITNGSFYISDEPDGTVSIYSIDAVVGLTFFDKGIKMTDMILFPGMYIRFDPQENSSLKGADLFKIMIVLGNKDSLKNTGLEFVNPRVNIGKDEDIFFMFKLPISTRPLFQMLHLLFRIRIDQVNLIKNYTSTRNLMIESDVKYIYNPSKKNFYLLDDLKEVLARAVRSNMTPADFRSKIEKIYAKSEVLIKRNSIQTTLEGFLTDARFAIFGNMANPDFNAIYAETASILKKNPDPGKGKLFQYLSDIYSRNIILQRKDPSFPGIDTYTPTADGLERTLNNSSIESKDYFDVALYAYQLLQKAQDGQVLTKDSLASNATYSLIKTLFSATEKYTEDLPYTEQKSAYQTLVIQFYAPIVNTISRSLYGSYVTYIGNKIYLDPVFLDGDVVKFDQKLEENLTSLYHTLRSTYDSIAPLYTSNDQQYAIVLYRDSLIRIGGFLDMIHEGKYRDYLKAPYVGVDVGGGILNPNVLSDGKIETFQIIPVLPTK